MKILTKFFLYTFPPPDHGEGHGQCNCGRCDCKVGWYGNKCELPRSCQLSAEESIKKCQGSSDLPCSGRGKWVSALLIDIQSMGSNTFNTCFLLVITPRCCVGHLYPDHCAWVGVPDRLSISGCIPTRRLGSGGWDTNSCVSAAQVGVRLSGSWLLPGSVSASASAGGITTARVLVQRVDFSDLQSSGGWDFWGSEGLIFPS